MTDEELRDKWLAYELYLFIIPYAFMYGNDFIKDENHSKWLRWQFEREWKRKTEEEKQERFNHFFQLLKDAQRKAKGGDS